MKLKPTSNKRTKSHEQQLFLLDLVLNVLSLFERNVAFPTKMFLFETFYYINLRMFLPGRLSYNIYKEALQGSITRNTLHVCKREINVQKPVLGFRPLISLFTQM